MKLPNLKFLILAGFGVPTAILATPSELQGWAFDNKLEAIGIFIAYEFMLALVPAVQETLKKWKLGLDKLVRMPIFDSTLKKYLEHLYYLHRNLDVKGLTTQGPYTLELERVFVDLRMVTMPSHKISLNPIRQESKEFRKDRYTIFELLKARKNQSISRNIVIIGAPGTGKTTLLKHIVLSIQAHKKVSGVRWFPVLLFLQEHALAISENKDYTLEQALRASLKSWKQCDLPDWFNKKLEKSCCLILLDGLDEVADSKIRKKVVTWVENQMKTHFPSHLFLTTSRPHGYKDNPLDDVTVFEVQTFTPEQVEQFTKNWYFTNEIMSQQKNDEGVEMDALRGAEDLLKRLKKTPTLYELATNPLLLTMIATIHRFRSSLPGRRVELYAEVCEVFLGKRKNIDSDMTPAQKQRVLEPLAYHMMSQEIREITFNKAKVKIFESLKKVNSNISPDVFLKDIEQSSGLLLERENGVYSFAHLTFQEYLAATHAKEKNLEYRLCEYVSNPWWHETLRLYAAQSNASGILNACMEGELPSLPALMLASDCLVEAQEIDSDVRKNTEEIFLRDIEHENLERRCIIAESMLSKRLKNFVPLNENCFRDQELITHAEYQIFLNEKREQKKYLQPDHWTEYQFPKEMGRKPVVGVRSSDAKAFCEWLTKRDSGNWRYRLPLAGELGGTENNVEIGYWGLSENSNIIFMNVPEVTLQSAKEKIKLAVQDIFTLANNSNRDRLLPRNRGRPLPKSHLDRALDCALDRALDRALDLDRVLGRSFSLGLDCVFGQSFSLNLDLALNRIRDRDRALDRALDRVIDSSLDHVLSAYHHCIFTDYYISNIIISLIWFIERRKSQLPAFEGIRIVREQRKRHQCFSI